MLITEYDYGALTAIVALASLVVGVRLLICTVRCRASKGRLTILLGGVATLFALSLASVFDAVDNIVWHPAMLVVPSAWLSAMSGLVMTIWFELFGRYVVERTEFERRLTALATTDPLTGILNRRACLESGQALAETARRYGHSLTVMMIDIDYFKHINDQYGHEAGDEMLRLFTSVVKRTLRQVDVFGRLGGEEFTVLMPETSQIGAAIAAERIRAAVEGASMARGENVEHYREHRCRGRPGYLG